MSHLVIAVNIIKTVIESFSESSERNLNRHLSHLVKAVNEI